MDVDGREDAFGQWVLFEQTPELERDGGIRSRFPGKIDAAELANSLAVVERVFWAIGGAPKAVLGDGPAQQAFQIHRGTATPFPLGAVERLNRRLPHRPRRHGSDLAEKPIPPRYLLLGRMLKIRKARLHGRFSLHFQCADSRMSSTISIGRAANKLACP
uniref:Uncharacterized protein n=1 Tax=uncultured bacterium P11N2 TaxID=1748282 RepID=A0A0U3TSI9_9BACT|nr:hypothetical protein [uncultured bacterium P11N2]